MTAICKPRPARDHSIPGFPFVFYYFDFHAGERLGDYYGVENQIINISRHNLFGFGRFNLTHPVSCYKRVVASDIGRVR